MLQFNHGDIKMQRFSKIVCSSLLSIAVSSTVIADNTRCVEVDLDQQPGGRTYEYGLGWIIYEGSLFRNLIDLSRMTGAKGIQPKLGHDVHFSKRFVTTGKDPQDIAKAINEEISGARVRFEDNFFWIEPTQKEVKSPITASASSLGCSVFTFQVDEAPLEEVMRKFSEVTMWEVDISSLPPLQKNMLFKARLIKGSSYFDILAKLVANTSLEVQIDDH